MKQLDLILDCVGNRNEQDSSLTLRMTNDGCHPEHSEGSRHSSHYYADLRNEALVHSRIAKLGDTNRTKS